MGHLPESKQELQERVRDLEARLEEKDNTISELQEQNEEQRYKEKYLGNLLESQNELVISVDLEYRFNYVNEAYCRTFGQTREELLGESFAPLVHEDDIEDTLKAMENLFVPPYRAYIEQRAKTVDGWRWLAWEDSAIRDENGQVVEILGVGRDITDQKQMEEELRERKAELSEQEALYRSLVEDHPHFVELYLPDTTIVFANKALAESIGYTPEELKGKKWIDFIPESERDQIRDALSSFSKKNPVRTNENSFIDEDGARRWHVWTNRAFFDEHGGVKYFQSTGTEITDRKQMEDKLRQSENYYRTIFETAGSAIFVSEEDTTISHVNSMFENLTGYSRQEVEGKKSWAELVPNDDLEQMMEYHYMRRRDPDAAPKDYEVRFFDHNNELRHAYLTVELIPETTRSVLSLVDITERKRMEEKLKEMSYYDSLTNLYSRCFFEEEMKRCSDERSLPLGVLMCDADGLKLMNDTLGHERGDELLQSCATILDQSFRSSDIVARFGGDEFAVLLPQCDEEVLRGCYERFHRKVEEYNQKNPQAGLSVSVGYALQHEPPLLIDDVLKRADDSMYEEKLHKSYNREHYTVRALINMMEERDHFADGHGERVRDYSLRLGENLGLPEKRLDDLSLLAHYHDLGKAGVPDSILFKQGPLTDEETKRMRQHPEVGRRIASVTNDLSHIADYILKHHERWDGSGYPLGLSGMQIPVECRIFSIADAYDSITSYRPYGCALSHEKAISELERCAGTQFDPSLVERFKGIS